MFIVSEKARLEECLQDASVSNNLGLLSPRKIRSFTYKSATGSFSWLEIGYFLILGKKNKSKKN